MKQQKNLKIKKTKFEGGREGERKTLAFKFTNFQFPKKIKKSEWKRSRVK